MPEIDVNSPAGFAAIWIGVQNKCGSFIQVGVIAAKVPQLPKPAYLAFWSDTSLGFRAHTLGVVRANDTVDADMTQTREGWRLSLLDDQAGLHSDFQSDYGGSQSFTTTEWTLEDPVNGRTQRTDLAFPQLSTVQFFDLRKDGLPARMSSAVGRSLATANNIFLVPTRVVYDDFFFMQATADQTQYLRDLGPLNFAQEQLGAVLAGSRSVSETAATSDFLAALENFRRQVSGQSWPPRVARAVRTLLRTEEVVIRDVRGLPPEFSASSDAFRRLQADITPFRLASHKVRAALGMPAG